MARQSNYQKKCQPCLPDRSQQEPGTSVSVSYTLCLISKQGLYFTQCKDTVTMNTGLSIPVYLCSFACRTILQVHYVSKETTVETWEHPCLLFLTEKKWDYYFLLWPWTTCHPLTLKNFESSDLSTPTVWTPLTGNPWSQLNNADKNCFLITLLAVSPLCNCLGVY